MKLFTIPGGAVITEDKQFQIGNQRYPAYWLASALPADVAAIGITVQIVADPVPPFSLDPATAAVAQSYAAGLRRKATKLKAKGDVQGSVSLLLKAAGVQQK